jgi:hypothetical protein
MDFDFFNSPWSDSEIILQAETKFVWPGWLIKVFLFNHPGRESKL